MIITRLFTSGILKVLRSFYRDAVRDRLGEILFSQEVGIAVVAGVVICVDGGKHFPDSAKLVDICLGFLSYAAIALGFCVGGVTIALTLPDRDFVLKLAVLHIQEKKGDALSGLFFVFCWTAVVHWLSILMVLFVLITRGHSEGHVLDATSVTEKITLGLTTAVSLYALMQFLITVLTLWQVGRNYIGKLQEDAAVEAKKTQCSK